MLLVLVVLVIATRSTGTTDLLYNTNGTRILMNVSSDCRLGATHSHRSRAKDLQASTIAAIRHLGIVLNLLADARKKPVAYVGFTHYSEHHMVE